MEQLTPEQARQAMQVYPGAEIYVLNGGHEKQMSTLAQQYRAISLVGATIQHLNEPKPIIGVVGGGAAGITAAALAAWRGCKVSPFEAKGGPISTYQSSNRWIHPRLYRWPNPDWNDHHAQLPLMSWESGEGRSVTRQLRRQWCWWNALYGTYGARRITYYPRTLAKPGWRPGEAATPSLAFTTLDGDTKTERFDAIFLAMGFGPPKAAPGFPLPRGSANQGAYDYDYWSRPKLEGFSRVLISGRQDSGLTEAIEAIVARAGKSAPVFNQQGLAELLADLEEHFPRETKILYSKLRSIMDREAAGRTTVTSPPHTPEDTWSELLGTDWWPLDQLIEHGAVTSTDATSLFLKLADRSVTLLVRGASAHLTPEAFLLNRFLVARLVKHKKVTIQPLGEESDLGKAHAATWEKSGCIEPANAAPLAGDRLLIRHGPTSALDANGWEQVARDFRNRSTSNRGIRTSASIAQQPPQTAEQSGLREGERHVLYSDLYDSVAQRLVLEVLQQKEAKLIRLYSNRVFFELARRDKVILTDNQLLDGAFFLRWLPLLERQIRAGAPIPRLVLKLRGQREGRPDPDTALCCFFSDGLKVRPYEFSAIADNKARKAVYRALMHLEVEGAKFEKCETSASERLLGTVVRHFENCRQQGENKCSETTAFIEEHLKKLCVLQAGAVHALRACQLQALTESYMQAEFDLFSAFDDPGDFGTTLRGRAGRTLAREAFTLHKGKPRGRTGIYAAVRKVWDFDVNDAAALDTADEQDARDVLDWYDRAYARAIARQHGATIFETVRTYGLQEDDYTDRHDAMKGLQKCRSRQPRLKTLHDLANAEPANVETRKNQTLLQIKKTSVVKVGDTPDRGRRALAVLLGATKVKRRHVAEASAVGAVVPAVIDEESGEKESAPILARVEYQFELPRVPSKRRRAQPGA